MFQLSDNEYALKGNVPLWPSAKNKTITKGLIGNKFDLSSGFNVRFLD